MDLGEAFNKKVILPRPKLPFCLESFAWWLGNPAVRAFFVSRRGVDDEPMKFFLFSSTGEEDTSAPARVCSSP